MAVYSMALATIHIGTTGAGSTKSEMEADTFVEIGEVQSFSALSDTQNFSTFTSLTSGRTMQSKSSKSGDNVTVTVGYDPDDAGQIALRAAAAVTTQAAYNMKVVYNDPAASKPTTIYFRGKVGNEQFPGGSVDDMELVEHMITNDQGFIVDLRA
tara:strand:+ start:7877 stop:8341 length:465 start_codon:yes stop_codon:yes gene_type:complete